MKSLAASPIDRGTAAHALLVALEDFAGSKGYRVAVREVFTGTNVSGVRALVLFALPGTVARHECTLPGFPPDHRPTVTDLVEYARALVHGPPEILPEGEASLLTAHKLPGRALGYGDRSKCSICGKPGPKLMGWRALASPDPGVGHWVYSCGEHDEQGPWKPIHPALAGARHEAKPEDDATLARLDLISQRDAALRELGRRNEELRRQSAEADLGKTVQAMLREHGLRGQTTVDALGRVLAENKGYWRELGRAPADPPKEPGAAVGVKVRYVPPLVELSDSGIVGPHREAAERFGLFAIPLATCPLCKKRMVEPIGSRSPFSRSETMTYEAQVKRADWVIESSAVTRQGEPVCVGCRDAGVLTFDCALCKTERPTTEIQESFGFPAEHLCRPCFASVPASAWAKKIEALEESHRYDWE